MKYLISIFAFHLMIIAALGQEVQLPEIIKSISEDLADNDSDPESVSFFTDKLFELYEKPVHLNSADESELSRLFFLTDFQIKALADYVHSSGNIMTIFEIANIPGFNKEVTEMINPFVTMDSYKEPRADSVILKNTLLTNFSIKFPKPEDQSSGPPWKMMTRYKFIAGRISGGLTFEKDAGEKLLSGKPPIPDFLSANLSWNGTGVLNKIIIGDFSSRFGLGTNINTGLRTGLSLTASGYLSGGEEIKPYTSTDENNFFRGAALQLRFKKSGLSLFYSLNKIDATLDSSNGQTSNLIKTFYTSGLHNSPSSIIKKDAISEYCYAINFFRDFRVIRAGLTCSGYRFSLPVEKSSLNPENLFDFEGKKNSIFSAYYKAVSGKMIFFGEVSSDKNRKIAFVQGLVFRPADRLNINILYRNYSPGYTSIHGKGPFSSSSGDNLKGILGNFTYEAARHLFLSAGYDLRFYPWLKYRCSAPSIAKSSEIRIKYLPDSKLTIEASFNYRLTILNKPETTGIKKQETFISRSVKGTVKYSFNNYLSFQTRVDFKQTNTRGSRGTVLLQDISWRFRSVPVSIWFRYCIFHTNDWDSRIYTYENDLAGSFSIPALAGEGSRNYIMIDWKPVRKFEIRIKYAVTDLVNTEGSVKESNELRFQLRLWF